MKTIQQKAALFTLLALGLSMLSHAYAAPPEKVTVTTANPNSALQGELLDVVISGSGFDHGSTVKYLVSGTSDDSQISVTAVTYNEADGTLTTTIQVAGAALISDYDIEVRNSSNRRGKGTTLFAVLTNESNAGGASEIITTTCDELFGFAPGTCTAEGTGDPCVFVKEFVEERAWKMAQHCDTRAMLVVSPDEPFLSGQNYRLNLVAPWSGDYAGITNFHGATRIGDFHIVVDDPNVADGCGAAGKAQAAVHFDPDREPKSSAPRGGVGENVVETLNGARFCVGIEFVGSDPRISHPYKQVGIGNNQILANSYERVGIWMANINMSDVNDETRKEFARVEGNIVEATDSPCAAGMLVGPNVERPQVRNNLVYAPGGAGCADRTVGLGVLDSGRNKASPLGSDYDFLSARTVDVSGNTVETGSDGSIGILIDGTTDAEMTKSQITAGEASDFAVCVESGANFSESGRRSDFIGFAAGNEVVNAVDCGAALP